MSERVTAPGRTASRGMFRIRFADIGEILLQCHQNMRKPSALHRAEEDEKDCRSTLNVLVQRCMTASSRMCGSRRVMTSSCLYEQRRP